MTVLAPPPRLHADELLDQEGHDPAELEESLAQVADVNRWLGGSRALRHHLEPLRRSGTAVRILDVGAGDGTVARGVSRWSARDGRGGRGGRGGRWTVVALDLHPQIARLARARGASLPVVRGDGLALPFADDTFDASYSVLTLHHFPAADAVRLLREMARVSRRLVLVNDLERSRLHHLGARLLAATVWRGNRLTRHDGPVSVLRSFTQGELLALGRAAGLVEPRVRRHTPWRLVLEGRP